MILIVLTFVLIIAAFASIGAYHNHQERVAAEQKKKAEQKYKENLSSAYDQMAPAKEEPVKEEPKKETASSGSFHNPVLDLDLSNVASTIKSSAEQRWKDDYQMQDYEVQQQTSAYNQLKNVAVDSEVKQTQMENALSRWGYDFEMVQYEYSEQMKAYNN